ncbi:dna repair protein rev1 [Lentinula edodes]|uniref:Dna repair protein rev1 n=1 Tax=Lentinula edodes TaxID=5353 RepID=A0A1Q3DVE2_LENED|nr:dna repair protein rev1 [Lentinula edodes]
MEKYLTNTDLISQNDTQDILGRAPGSARFKPYTILERKCGPKKKNLLDLLPESGNPPSSSSVTKLLLKTMKEAANPIAHSDLYERTEHVVSMASGHQVSESRRNHRPYLQERSRKLSVQKETTNAAEQPQILSNVKVYIDGFLTGTTDIEMKRVVSRAGGQILYSASGATHILSSQSLSGSKTHRLLSKKTRISVHVVRPEWVFDSIKAGKRRPERDYTILKNSSTLMMQKPK